MLWRTLSWYQLSSNGQKIKPMVVSQISGVLSRVCGFLHRNKINNCNFKKWIIFKNGNFFFWRLTLNKMNNTFNHLVICSSRLASSPQSTVMTSWWGTSSQLTNPQRLSGDGAQRQKQVCRLPFRPSLPSWYDRRSRQYICDICNWHINSVGHPGDGSHWEANITECVRQP